MKELVRWGNSKEMENTFRYELYYLLVSKSTVDVKNVGAHRARRLPQPSDLAAALFCRLTNILS